jgi:glycosyltransferase involved in cell wall biosynthesis
MRIGIFDPYLDDLGGGEKYILQLAICLSQKHAVTIFWDNADDIKALRKRFGLPTESLEIRKNILELTVIQKAKAMKDYDAFIVLSDGSIPFVYPKKLYLHIQQPLPKHKLSFKYQVKLACITGIFYNSEFTKKFNDLLFPGVKSTVIYPPVSLEINEGKTGRKSKKNVILHVGRFRVKDHEEDDYKKQFFMVDAFKKLVDSGFTNWQFFVASSVKEEDRNDFEKLKKNARGYPIAFYVNKTNSELFDLYNEAKIYWHASGYGEDLENHPELAEHFGMSTVEAMGAGVVPVVIDRGGQREIVTDGENGLLWLTFDELISQTKRLANDEKLWHELSKNAVTRAKDFSKQKFYDAVNKLVT